MKTQYPSSLYQSAGRMRQVALTFMLAVVIAVGAGVQMPVQARTSSLPDFTTIVEKSEAAKCERCWHRREDVGSNSQYPDICERCVENITTEQGEHREFA